MCKFQKIDIYHCKKTALEFHVKFHNLYMQTNNYAIKICKVVGSLLQAIMLSLPNHSLMSTYNFFQTAQSDFKRLATNKDTYGLSSDGTPFKEKMFMRS